MDRYLVPLSSGRLPLEADEPECRDTQANVMWRESLVGGLHQVSSIRAQGKPGTEGEKELWELSPGKHDPQNYLSRDSGASQRLEWVCAGFCAYVMFVGLGCVKGAVATFLREKKHTVHTEGPRRMHCDMAVTSRTGTRGPTRTAAFPSAKSGFTASRHVLENLLDVYLNLIHLTVYSQS